MTLETFFEKFDQFADAPDAVAKMRELVRHLAVTGKLVDQDPSEESGEQLLKKISAERLAAVKARQISPMKPLPAVGEEELLFEPQPGWAPARLIELVMEIQTGPFGSSLHKSDYQLGGTPVINPASLKDGKIVPIDEMAIGHATLRRLEVFKLNAGDIVMARRGEMGRCAVVTKNEEGWLCGTGSLLLRMPRSLYAPYLAMLIGAPMARTYLGGASVGTTMQNLNQSILARMPVGVPPLAEQKRIVAKVDELMALYDRLEAQQQEREKQASQLTRASLARFADAPTPANLDYLFHSAFIIPPSDLRKSILTLAVQGKLVPQDPNDEPAEELFARIESTKEKLIKERTIKRVAVEANPSGDECEPLPPGWLWTRLGNSFDIRDGTHDTPKYTTEGFPLITSKNIYSGSLLFDGANLISERDHRQISDRSRVDRGDILFAMIGSIGNPVIVDTDREFSIKNVALFKYYTAVDSEPRFLLLYLKLVAEEMRAKAAGGVQSFVSLGFLRNYLFPLPPLAEQRRIVAKVEQLMALVDALETQLAASRKSAGNLLSALVAELTAARVPVPSATGAAPSQPGATPQVHGRKHDEG